MAKAIKDLDDRTDGLPIKGPVRATLAENMSADGEFDITGARAMWDIELDPVPTTAWNVHNFAGQTGDAVTLLWDKELDTAGAYAIMAVDHVSGTVLNSLLGSGCGLAGNSSTIHAMSAGVTAPFTITSTSQDVVVSVADAGGNLTYTTVTIGVWCTAPGSTVNWATVVDCE